MMTNQKKTGLALKVVCEDGASYGGFRWPLTVGATVAAPDWQPTTKCGNGLHAWLYGHGNGTVAAINETSKWLVVEVVLDECIDLDGKIKIPSCVVRFVGDRKSATDYLIAHEDMAATKPVIGRTAVVGDGQIALVGDYGFAQGGYCATVSGGYCATVSGGYRATVSGGEGATVSGGDYATVSGGDDATVSGGDGATVSGGVGATVSGGDYATVSGGVGATVSGGDYATLQIKHHDGSRFRVITAYVGEDGILPNVQYVLNNAGKFVEKKA